MGWNIFETRISIAKYIGKENAWQSHRRKKTFANRPNEDVSGKKVTKLLAEE